jgi:D-alanyl-D-alanine carboxypeptidase
MKPIKQKFFFLCLLIIFALPNFSLAQVKNQNWTLLDPATLPCKVAVVLDMATGNVLYSYNEEEFSIPASLTKLLTAMVFLDRKPNLNTIVSLKKEDEVGGGRLRVNYGSKLSLKDALYSTLIASTNNTAMILARASGLSYKDFVSKMNLKAQNWGLDAYFHEAAGMSTANITTPIQMAKIAREAFKYPLIRQISQLPKYEFKIRNTGLLKNVTNTDALVNEKSENFILTASKTGYLPEAGNNLAISAKNSNGPGEVVILVMGSETKPASFAAVKTLAEWSFKNYTWKK